MYSGVLDFLDSLKSFPFHFSAHIGAHPLLHSAHCVDLRMPRAHPEQLELITEQELSRVGKLSSHEDSFCSRDYPFAGEYAPSSQERNQPP